MSTYKRGVRENINWVFLVDLRKSLTVVPEALCDHWYETIRYECRPEKFQLDHKPPGKFNHSHVHIFTNNSFECWQIFYFSWHHIINMLSNLQENRVSVSTIHAVFCLTEAFIFHFLPVRWKKITSSIRGFTLMEENKIYLIPHTDGMWITSWKVQLLDTARGRKSTKNKCPISSIANRRDAIFYDTKLFCYSIVHNVRKQLWIIVENGSIVSSCKYKICGYGVLKYNDFRLETQIKCHQRSLCSF